MPERGEWRNARGNDRGGGGNLGHVVILAYPQGGRKTDAVTRLCPAYRSGAMTMATIAMSFSRMLSDGPAVSLKGSPTVSPIIPAL